MADADKAISQAPPAPVGAVSALKAQEAITTADGDAAMSGASTPVPTIEEQALSVKVSLADLCAKGTAAYSYKEYEKAADLFAYAAEMQAELNGEMNPENAEIFFLYGRSLFKLGQAKSDVLGGQATGVTDDKKNKPNKESGAASKKAARKEQGRSSKGAAEVEGKELEKKAEEKGGEKKSLFQFTGDENFDDDSVDEDGEEDEEEGEDDDDMGVAFEILDLSRVLFGKRLEGQTQSPVKLEGKGKQVEDGELSPEVRHIKERLADTHDLLTEISWENERYAQSVTDARKSLGYKKELYKDDNEIVAEAHYKVSLALEFASVTQTEEDAEKAGETSVIDEGLREEAAKELENAIRCTRLNLDNKEVELATIHAPEENEITRARIAEVKDLIVEMEQRLEDLRKPPIDINAAIASGTGAAGGLLGALASGVAGSAQVEEAKKNAKDLSLLVRKNKKIASSAGNGEAAMSSNGTNNGAKRKAGEPLAEQEGSKKPKVTSESEIVEA